YDFYTEGLARLREIAEVYTTDEFVSKSYIPLTKAKVGVRIAGNLIEVDMGDLGYNSAELLAALESWRVKKKYHRLTDGRFMDMSAISDAAEILDAFEVGKSEFRSGVARLPMYRGLYLNSILERQQTAVDDPKFNEMLTAFGGKVEHGVPASLNDILRPYQKTGYQWLRSLTDYNFGGILADEMGLGKTIQIIALIQATLDQGKPSVVVSPTSLAYNWEHEFQRFAPDIKTVVVMGAPDRRKELLREQADVFITTYDTLKRDIDAYAGMKFKYVVADEAQYMKNPATQNASAVKELVSEARFALTGTPIENSLTELWSIFDFIMPGYLFSQVKFSRLFEVPVIKHGDNAQALKLKKQIAPFIMRRLKKDVLTELPDKVETVFYSGMEDGQRKMYAAYLMQARGELHTANQMEILALLTRLRQICCHPVLFAEGYNDGSGKLELAMDTITAAVESGHRVLLFSQFTSMLDILNRRLDNAGLPYFYLDGSTPAKERLEMVNKFNSGERDVFSISLKAGGTGLNLTGADVVVHYDPWWNPAVMDQATDRAHRYGQDKVVQVITLVAKDSIEERILDLQAKKKGLVDSVIAEGGNFLSHMTVDELKELFKE
ncbi:MAG: SNF2 family helicase, partial [Defluviitaleaceae bacterium]|nr:SNF2 family helicase [Defluviitaleaceae bacterium]